MTAPRRWLLPTATVGMALLGGAALVAGLVSLPGADAVSPSASGEPAATAAGESHPSPVPTLGGAADLANAPVSQLADPDWIEEIAAAGSIPQRALAAYAGASLAVEATHPGCGLGWNTLAAIGHVESEHGSIHGSRIGDDGVAAPGIIGIPLDGTSTEAIADTDGGLLDGDAVWDRAVGPMQFIPTTWAQYAVDGNADGAIDVHSIDDAALTAAVYLCAAGGDLGEAPGWIAAVDAYNPSTDYNHRVAEAASHYATLG